MENALGAEKWNVPPASVNVANVQSQWKHLANVELQDVNRAEIGIDATEMIIILWDVKEPTHLS